MLIAELDRDGHDTNEAIMLLAKLKQAKKLHERRRERILLDAADNVQSGAGETVRPDTRRRRRSLGPR
jgi:hypothetical protein